MMITVECRAMRASNRSIMARKWKYGGINRKGRASFLVRKYIDYYCSSLSL